MDGDETGIAEITEPIHTLAVGNLQIILDELIADHPHFELDYIHGEDTLEQLSANPEIIGFLLPAMGKEKLFESVIKDGPLPRKTFSMGVAREKRYYLEARLIA
jgi:hypothetical protein